MTKEEVIKEAYIEYWEQLSDSAKFHALNNNGWLHYNHILFANGTLLDCIEMDCLSNIDTFRPKSLQGIENNNGWIRIESEANLPKETGYYHVINKKGKYFRKRYLKHMDSQNEKWKQVTYYQPIIKPNHQFINK